MDLIKYNQKLLMEKQTKSIIIEINQRRNLREIKKLCY